MSSGLSTSTCAQSLRKEEARAINRTQLRLVTGDTVQQFAISARERKHPRRQRMYYWYAGNHIHRTQGEFNGRLLHGMYRLTTREGQTLQKGRFHYGTKTGRWQQWYSTGRLASESRWHRGNLRGRPLTYDQQGSRFPADATESARAAWSVKQLNPFKKRVKKKAAVTPVAETSQPAATLLPVADGKRTQRKPGRQDRKARSKQVPAQQPLASPPAP